MSQANLDAESIEAIVFCLDNREYEMAFEGLFLELINSGKTLKLKTNECMAFALHRFVPVPFIADDIMETFDEPRSEEVFRLLAEMANIGQVIYLTHYKHLCDIAQKVVPIVRIHEIRLR